MQFYFYRIEIRVIGTKWSRGTCLVTPFFARIKFCQHRSAYRMHIKLTLHIKIFSKINIA
jgi:hypothetical protein